MFIRKSDNILEFFFKKKFKDIAFINFNNLEFVGAFYLNLLISKTYNRYNKSKADILIFIITKNVIYIF